MVGGGQWQDGACLPDSRGVEGERGGHGGEEDGSSRGEGEGEDMNEENGVSRSSC